MWLVPVVALTDRLHEVLVGQKHTDVHDQLQAWLREWPRLCLHNALQESNEALWTGLPQPPTHDIPDATTHMSTPSRSERRRDRLFRRVLVAGHRLDQCHAMEFA